MLLWHAPYWQINNTSASLLWKLYIYIVWTTREKTVWHKLAAKQLLVLQQVLRVCQYYLTQRNAMGGWTLLHCDPINFISARHTFWHARSVRRGSGGLKGVEVSGEASGNNWERGSGRIGQSWGILTLPLSWVWVSAQGEENAITRALSAFSGKCGV